MLFVRFHHSYKNTDDSAPWSCGFILGIRWHLSVTEQDLKSFFKSRSTMLFLIDWLIGLLGPFNITQVFFKEWTSNCFECLNYMIYLYRILSSYIFYQGQVLYVDINRHPPSENSMFHERAFPLNLNTLGWALMIALSTLTLMNGWSCLWNKQTSSSWTHWLPTPNLLTIWWSFQLILTGTSFGLAFWRWGGYFAIFLGFNFLTNC